MFNIDKELKNAESLIEAGDIVGAKKKLKSLLHTYSNDKNICFELVNIYLAGNLYNDAKEVFKRYKKQVGMDLNAEISLKEIEEEQKNKRIKIDGLMKGNKKKFSCVSFWQRAKAGGVIQTFFPIYEIYTCSKGFSIKNKKGVKDYQWNDVKDKKIIRRKQEGEYSNTYFKYLKLFVENEKITLNLTNTKGFNYFNNVDLLMSEFQKYLHINS